MARSGYIADIRSEVGSRLLLVPSASIILVDDQDRILLLHHHDGGLWGTPGGAIEPGERPADAAVREAWEETGLQVALTAVIGVFGGPGHELTYDNGDVTAYVSVVFRAGIVGGRLRLAAEEVDASRWVGQDERPELPTTALTREILDAAFAHVASPVAPTYFAPARWVAPTATPDPGNDRP